MYVVTVGALNMRPCDFWYSTPYELDLLVDWHNKREKAEQKKEIADIYLLAWNIANYNNAKKLPNINNILKDIYKEEKKISSKKRMSQEEIQTHYKNKVVR